MEVQRKSAGQASPASPTLFCFKVTSLDFDRTQTRLTAEFGQVRRIPLEVQRTVRWVHQNWLGLVKVRWKRGGSVKYTWICMSWRVFVSESKLLTPDS